MLLFFFAFAISKEQKSSNINFKNFKEALDFHLHIYPKGQIRDWIKLAFQNEFGPEHLVSSFDEALKSIIEEWTQSNYTSLMKIEPLGNGIDRYYLEPNDYSYSDAVILTNLFIEASQNHKGNETLFLEKLDIIQSTFPNTTEIEEYLKEGIHPVHHSAIYDQVYQPHYRLIEHTDSKMMELYQYVYKIIEKKPNAIIAIDGRCGSGKTFLAQRIAKLFNMELIHIDDFYLPKVKRPSYWNTKPAAHMDFTRLSKELLAPLYENKTGIYKPFICRIQDYGEEKCVERKSAILVEGSYCLHPSLTPFYDTTIFINADFDIRMNRLKEREGNRFPMFETTWIPLEEMYLNEYSIPDHVNFTFTNN